MGHFLLALALVGVSLTMLRRTGESGGETRYVVSSRARIGARVVYVLAIWVVIAGTLVTAAGPHGGDAKAKRLTWPIQDVARLHGVSVNIFIAAVLALIVVLWREHAPKRVLNTTEALLVVMVAQAILGYVQYFEGVPPVLVGFHVAGAVLVFGTVHQLQLEIRHRGEAIADVPRAGPAWRTLQPAGPAAGN